VAAAGWAWLQPYLQRAVKTRQVAFSLTPGCEVTLINDTAMYHGYDSLRSMITACHAAVAGSSGKRKGGVIEANNAGFTNGSVPLTTDVGSAGDAAAAAAGVGCFGWRVRISGSFSNFAYRDMVIATGILSNVTATGLLSITTPVLQLVVTPRVIPADIFILNVANAAGYGTIVPGNTGQLLAADGDTALNGVLINLVDATTFASIESLNARDLLTRTGKLVTGDEELFDEFETIDEDPDRWIGSETIKDEN